MVSCVCITRNRRDWLPKMLECFLSQTYEDRELLILADGDRVDDLMPSDPRIRLIYLEEQLKCFPKRNRAASLTTGELIAHFDDDDFSAPGRLADQVARLQETGKAVTGYRSMRFTDGVKWWRYCGTPNFVLDTSLIYRREWWLRNPFPESGVQSHIGGEIPFTSAAYHARQLASADAGEFMYATIHPANTCKKLVNGSSWTKIA